MFRIFDLQHPAIYKSGDEIIFTAVISGLSADYLGGSDRFVKVGGEAIAIGEITEFAQSLPYDPNQQPDDGDSI